MVFKTLHWYISRELLKIFFLTASALTTLLAFGGTFKEVTKKGVEASQLMTIMTNLMPAMLAYTIPVAALFAAVLVYWRLSTDNELTACRASGISFVAIVMPALFLGVVMASTDLLFVNYVVPMFLQRAERALYADFGSMVVSQIGKQESFSLGNFPYVFYADRATKIPTNDPDTTLVRLDGMAGLFLKNGKPDMIFIARQADLRIRDPHSEAGVQLSGHFVEGALLNPKTYQKASASLDSQVFPGGTFTLPSVVKSKPKFANLKTLRGYQADPTLFPPVKETIDKIAGMLSNQEVAQRLLDMWKAGGGGAVKFGVNAYSTAGVDQIRIHAPEAKVSAGQMVYFSSREKTPVEVEQYSKGVLKSVYKCREATVVLVIGEYPTKEVNVSLQLTGDVKQVNSAYRTNEAVPAGDTSLPGVVMPTSMMSSTAVAGSKGKLEYVKEALASDSPALKGLGDEAMKRMTRLGKVIDAELHSRASFSVACLTLVMLGAALGILMRGKNPLAVFVGGFVPAIVLVLLITAGRQVFESSPNAGLVLIWFGNGIILLMVSAVYTILLRH